MVRSYDVNEVSEALENLKLTDEFICEGLCFSLCRFSKGELLSSPLKSQTDIFFLTRGKVQFYALRSDGQLIPVNLGKVGTVIGDVEFAGQGSTMLYAQALTQVECLALNLPRNRSALEESPSFLRYMLKSLCGKVYLGNPQEQVAVSVEEKLTLYLKACEGDSLSGISELSKTFGCSRRQLERVIGKFCREGRLCPVRKGHYEIRR